MTKVWLVIPAAGIGQRMQSAIPKQYMKIHGKTILEHTLDCFLQCDDVAGIVVTVASDDKYWNLLSINNPQKKPLIAIEGGADRAKSVLCGLDYLFDAQKIPSDSWVMVHDAARPCLSKVDLDSLLLLRDVEGCVGGLLAIPVRDTMKRSQVSQGKVVVSHTESRDELWHAQTPQMFRLGDIKSAIETCHKSNFDITDECSAMEFIGESPVIIESKKNNIKVTTPGDIVFSEYLLGEKER